MKYTDTEAEINYYIEMYLKDIDCKARRAGNCYRVGSSKYVRKDGTGLTQEDFDTLRQLDNGQINIVVGNPGDMFAIYTWECDSSG